MALTAQVDVYCERIDPGFWAEPLNAFTNGAFLLAAWLLAAEAARLRRAGVALAPEVRALAPLLALVGVCSFLFHTLATVWAGLADTLSILLFGAVFLYAFLRSVAQLPTAGAAGLAGVFAAVSYFFPRALPPDFLNGSGAYFPYLAGMLILAGLLVRAGHRSSALWFSAAIATFCISLALRTVDAPLCARFPQGTHFAWHLLNAIVLYAFGRTLLRECACSAQLTLVAPRG
jgi:hypothetical protein